jgi:hypothetical protein
MMEIENVVKVTDTVTAKVTVSVSVSVVVLKATTEIKMEAPWGTMDGMNISIDTVQPL